MIKKRNFLLLLFLLSISIFAQKKKISGFVKENSGTPMYSVNIVNQETKAAVSSGFDGAFSIIADEGDVLVFSFLGFTTRDVKASNSMNVTLNEDTKVLKEVVIGSLGRKLNKASLGYATQTIAGAEIADTQRSNFINGLQGRVAGLTVTSTSGAPGASAAIQLRGVNSISGNNSPLYIVDGLPISNQTISQGSLISDQPNRNQDYTNRGADINPDDIESLTILKGPEAAALYGIEAGNGAIVITTKKGKKGEGTFTYTNNTKFESIYRFPEVQQTFQRGSNGLSDDVTYRRHFGARYAAGTKFYDNVGNFFETGITKTNNLTFSGGSETITYRLSVANLNQTGVIPNTSYGRLNIGLNGTAKINEHLKSETSFSFTKATNVKASKGGGGYLLNLLLFPANVDASNYLNPDGTRVKLSAGTTANPENDNPYWDVNRNKAEDDNNRMLANVGLIYDPLNWLNFTGRLGFDTSAGRGFRSVHPESFAGLATTGFIETYQNNVRNTSTTLLASAKKSLGKFNSKLLVGSTIDDRFQRILSTSGTRFIEPNFVSINNVEPTTQRSQERLIQKKVIGVLGEIDLDYDKILNITLTGRSDWTSTLPKGKNQFFYPSVSSSFVFSEIGALKDNNTFSFGKLRASYAVVGNDAIPYGIEPSYQPQGTTNGGYAYGVTGANPGIKPEFRKSVEFGTELKFFNNRLGLDVSTYRSETKQSIINNLRLSYGTGFVVSSFNFGDLRNEGLEITLNASPIKNDNFTWNTNVNFTKTNSELLSLPKTLPEYYVSDTWLFNNVRAGSRVGGSLTSFTGWSYKKNNAGQILINPTDGLPIVDTDFNIIGDRNPDFVLGIQNSLRYKNFTASFLLDVRKGGDIFNGTEMALWQNGLSTRSLDREQPLLINGVIRDGLENTANPTQNNIQITPYYQENYYRSGLVESDFIEKDINWLRMREIVLAYNFSSNFIKRTKFFSSISLNFTMTDVFMITNYTGADPAVNGLNASTGGSGGAGFDYGALATPRGMNLGIRLGI